LRIPVLLTLISAFALRVTAASADEPAAQALFEEGRKDLDRGDYEAACKKLRASWDASDALGPLLNLADCEEKRGKLATALALWQKGSERLAQRSNDERAEIAKRHIEDLEERAPRISISLAPSAPKASRVSVDGAEVSELPASIPVDPGAHEVVVTAKGFEDSRTSISLRAEERKTFEAAPGAALVGGDGGMSGRRVAGFVVGGVGLAGFVAFGVTGGLMLGHQSTVDTNCDAARRTCNQAGLEAAKAGESLVIPNGVALGVGIAGAALGAILIITGGEKKPAALGMRAFPGGGMVSLEGHF